ncbi:MAG: hypothetical protein A2722_03205 [Candidatus Doudnabacteria bacterium RIFCSPHIGHO2_01_FULL_50_11]|uniref:NADPH-dependent FMN reductase-like domain-containing protein n=1 Tax=Candidatus Doudnabacteria bacterium RIFCSPHIGHO2_01_FULL_50_11 TaxID=1817828 RepID=A0A1F5PKU0_9BACT|nr:MAG: hypothetical protein A2722_03205 [Candidatus Doudnabacteria bacterium RIFCSPHIGHO2_01_FULL_50_11]HLC45034.1 flavodoxin family protein [Patescibacteria group bacterium]
MKIIGFDGSTIPNSTTAGILARALVAASEQGAETSIVRLKDVITSPFHGAHDPASLTAKAVYDALPITIKKMVPGWVKKISTDYLFPEEVKPLLRAIEEADGLILATPTWWSTPSDYIKILLNYLTICDYRNYCLRGKVAGFIAVCEEDGAQHANAIMQNAVTHMGMITPPFCSFFFNRNLKESEQNWQETDQALVGVNVVRMCKLLRGEVTGANWDWNSAQ